MRRRQHARALLLSILPRAARVRLRWRGMHVHVRNGVITHRFLRFAMLAMKPYAERHLELELSLRRQIQALGKIVDVLEEHVIASKEDRAEIAAIVKEIENGS